MILKELKPKEIFDVVAKMDEYLDIMRAGTAEDINDLFEYLYNYIYYSFFDEGYSPESFAKMMTFGFKALAVIMSDRIYCKIMRTTWIDMHTVNYFEEVFGHLFYELAQNDARVFFSVNNLITDGQFKVLVGLFELVGFVVIHPYTADINKEIDYTDEYTVLPAKPYKQVCDEVSEAIKNKKHVLYIEKGTNETYLIEATVTVAINNRGKEEKQKHVITYRIEGLDKSAKHVRTWY